MPATDKSIRTFVNSRINRTTHAWGDVSVNGGGVAIIAHDVSFPYYRVPFAQRLVGYEAVSLDGANPPAPVVTSTTMTIERATYAVAHSAGSWSWLGSIVLSAVDNLSSTALSIDLDPAWYLRVRVNANTAAIRLSVKFDLEAI